MVGIEGGLGGGRRATVLMEIPQLEQIEPESHHKESRELTKAYTAAECAERSRKENCF